MKASHTSRSRPLHWTWWFFAAAAAFYLISEHRTHVAGAIGWLPFLIFLACPLMHLFGHGHGGRHDSQSTQADAIEPDPGAPLTTTGRERHDTR